MFKDLIRDAQIAVVRDQLDNLGKLRSKTGLIPSEERHYRDLCAMEKKLLAPRIGSPPLAASV